MADAQPRLFTRDFSLFIPVHMDLSWERIINYACKIFEGGQDKDSVSSKYCIKRGFEIVIKRGREKNVIVINMPDYDARELKILLKKTTKSERYAVFPAVFIHFCQTIYRIMENDHGTFMSINFWYLFEDKVEQGLTFCTLCETCKNKLEHKKEEKPRQSYRNYYADMDSDW